MHRRVDGTKEMQLKRCNEEDTCRKCRVYDAFWLLVISVSFTIFCDLIIFFVNLSYYLREHYFALLN